MTRRTCTARLLAVLTVLAAVHADSWSDSKDVNHVSTVAEFEQALKDVTSSMVLFYKSEDQEFQTIKPHFVRAAQKLRGKAAFLAVDVSDSQGQSLATTKGSGGAGLLYFKDGVKDGEQTAYGIVKYITNKEPDVQKRKARAPAKKEAKKKKAEEAPKAASKDEKKDDKARREKEWSDTIPHLTEDSFDTYLQDKAVLVMFYAPWCGHCKAMKPQYVAAYRLLPELGLPQHSLAAVDGTKQRSLTQKLNVGAYPTVLYFKNGKKQLETNVRREDQIIKFLKNPSTYDPQKDTGNPDESWEQEKDMFWDEVTHLTSDTHKAFVDGTEHSMVFYYKPDDITCRAWKYQYYKAGREIKNERSYKLAVLNCAQSEAEKICKDFATFPKQIYYNFGKNSTTFNTKDRSSERLLKFLKDPLNPENSDLNTVEDKPWKMMEGGEYITDVTDKTFSKVIKKTKSALVMFYAPWCTHCVAMKPTYALSGLRMKTQKIQGDLLALDADKNKKTAEKYKIRSYPTLYYFKDGKKAFTVTHRTAEDIITFMKNPEEPTTKKMESWEVELEGSKDVYHLNDDVINEFLKKHKHVLVFYYTPWCPHCRSSKVGYYEAAKVMKEKDKTKKFALFDCERYKSVCQQRNITSYPTLYYYSHGKNKIQYHGSRTLNHLTLFMGDPSNPNNNAGPEIKDQAWSEIAGAEHLVHITDDNYKHKIKDHDSLLVMFYAPWCGHCKAMKAAFAEAAKIMADRGMTGKLGTLDAVQEQKTAGLHGVDAFPTMLYFRAGDMKLEYTFNRAAKDFVNFMKNPLGEDGYLDSGKDEEESEPAQEEEEEEEEEEEDESKESIWIGVTNARYVHNLQNSNFENFLENHDSVLVFFYSAACPNCQAMKEAYAEAAKMMTETNHIGKMAAVRGPTEKSLCEKYNVKQFPTLMYFRMGKFDFEYDGDREAHSLLNLMMNPGPKRSDSKKKKKMKPKHEIRSQHLMEHEFKEFIHNPDHKHVLVFFYDPKRPLCQDARKEFEDAIGYLNSPDKRMVAVDCDDEEDLCKKHKIDGYPMLKYYLEGRYVTDYRGPRKMKEISEFINYKIHEKDEL